jgi:hypothetical protein
MVNNSKRCNDGLVMSNEDSPNGRKEYLEGHWWEVSWKDDR